MFKRLKIRTLIIGMVCFFVVTTAALSVYSIFRVNQFGERISRLSNVELRLARLIGEIGAKQVEQELAVRRGMQFAVEGNMQSYGEAQSEFEGLGTTIDSKYAESEQVLRTARAQSSSDDDRDALGEMLTSLSGLHQSHSDFEVETMTMLGKVRSMIRQSMAAGEKQNTDATLNSTVQQFLGTITSSGTKTYEALGNVRRMVSSLTEANVGAADQLVGLSRTHLQFGGIAIVLIGFVSGVLIARSIVTRLHATVLAVRQASEGDLQAKVVVTRDDEIGDVGLAINTMQETLAEVTRVATAISEGDLTVNPPLRSDRDSLGLAMKKMVGNLREVVSTVQDVASHVVRGCTELQQSAQAINSSASAQAISVQQTSAAMEQMTEGIKQNATNAETTEQISTRVAANSTKSVQSVQRTAESMRGIAEKIGLVEEITRKTDLLALNASVEAARAGEHGKGFAVVASEVSKLAVVSQKAAAEIVQSSSEGKNLAEATSRMLTELLPDIEKTKDLVQGISSLSEEQSIGASQVNRAVQDLDKLIQTNASSSKTMFQTAETLSSQSRNLEKSVTFFRIDRGPARLAKQSSDDDDMETGEHPKRVKAVG
ncbi:MAG: HAMP domain-containing methyl-accepting chemotaxis protein [Planctomycetota bacterium]|nr:HAMP domain-containing methyl-accepting chemotaxis protein [Planctomycetota bacterium]